MRSHRRIRREEEEEESSFVSMTDLTVSFLFVLMVLVAFLATKIGAPDSVSEAIHAAVLAERDTARQERDAAIEEARRLREILAGLRRALAALEVDLDTARLRLDTARSDMVLQRDRADRAELDLADATERLDAATLARRQSEEQLEALRREIGRLEAALVTMSDEVSAQSDALGLLTAALRSSRFRIVMLEQEVARLRARVEALERELEQTNARDRAARDRLADHLEQVARNLNRQFGANRVRALRDVLRFEGEGIFARGRWDLGRESRAIVEALAEELVVFLPCLTVLKEEARGECDPYEPVMETVLIEGHTDTTGPESANLDLSIRRAQTTFQTVVSHEPRLMELRNRADQALLAVAGYGWQRPVVRTPPNTDEPRNRRIDLRFILAPSRSVR